MMATSRLRFQHYQSSWMFGTLALLFGSFAVMASNHFPISNADGYVTIGPLDRDENVAAARARLDKNDVYYRVEDSSAKESLGFIVVTQKYANKSAASNDLRGLAESGITDSLYVRRGDYVNRISVGVFGTQVAAQNWAAKLNKLGFRFSVIERFRTRGTATSIVIREPGPGIDELERILAGQVAKDEPGMDSISADPTGSDIKDFPVPELDESELGESELRVGKGSAEPVQDKKIITSLDNPKPAGRIPDIIAPSPDATPVIRTLPPAEESGWLWYLFAGAALIITGALAYYYQQQRSQAEWVSPQQADQPAKIETETSSEDRPENLPTPEPPTQQVIFEYAEAVLEGRGNDRSGRSLTILGTDDTSVIDLIQDLLFLTRLEEKKESIEAFAFDSRSLVDSLITRLSAENPNSSASLRSAPSDELPLSLSLDANKLARILSILLQHAIERTESGLISIHQQFKSGQLTTELRYHPSGRNIATELEAMTNPALPSPSLNIGDRVKFGVANRLALVLDGRLDASYDAGEAIVRICLPAVEIQAQQLSLPSGKSIDELIAAESRAAEEVERTEREAEARVLEAVTRANDIEQNADRSIQNLKDEITGISAASAESTRNLQASEDAISTLRNQLQQAVEERDQQLNTVRQEKADTLAELESVNTELVQTKVQLEKETSARESSEKSAKVSVTELEARLVTTRTSLEQEGKMLRAREDAAKAQVDELESQLNQLQSSMDAESKNALQALSKRLTGAESKLSQETEFRAQSETVAQGQIKELLQQVNDAKSIADSATAEKQHLDTQLKQTMAELEQSRIDLESKISRLEQNSEAALADVSMLKKELSDASDSLEHEKISRLDVESEGKAAVQKLERELTAARQDREEELAAKEQRISKAQEEIEKLTRSLEDAEEKLREQLSSQKDSSDKDDVIRLQSELNQAQEKLDAETNRQNVAESSAVTQIDELVNELNQLRASTSEAISENGRLEKEKQEQVEQTRHELELAGQSLEEERNQHSRIREESERTLKEMEQKLAALEKTHSSLAEKTEQAEAFGQQQTEMLLEALSDAQSAHRTGEATRKVTQHLKSKIRKLESQVKALKSWEPETSEDMPGESTPKPQEPEPAIEDEPILEPEEPEVEVEVEVEVEPEPEQAAKSFEGSDDRDFSLEGFDEDEYTHEFNVVQNDIAADAEDQLELQIEEPATAKESLTLVEEPSAAPNEEPSAALNEQPSAFPNEEPSAFPNEEPSAALNEQPSAALNEQPSAAPNEEPSASLNKEPPESNALAPSKQADPAASIPFKETPEGPDEDEEPEYEFQFDDKPIRSSRPVNNPILHSMIGRFNERLLEHIDSMGEALSKRDYLELVVSCNWVRGEANTLGFETLITPINAIEHQLRKNKFSQIITHLSELRNMAERIEFRHTPPPDAPIQYVIPAHAKSSIIYENFVSQLGSKLLELEVAAHAENSRQMTQLCRWIDRYGEKIKFQEVLDASSQLQEAIETGDSSLIEQQLIAFIELYEKIEIIKEDAYA